MPNTKIYIDHSLSVDARDAIVRTLPALKALLSEAFNVDPSICQITVISTVGAPDQAPISAELVLMPKKERTRDALTTACEALRGALAAIAPVQIAIRATTVDPDNYLVLR